MILSKESFDNMIINPYGDDFDFESHRDLLNNIMGGIWRKRSKLLEKIVKYILYMYDLRSPMRRQISEIKQRKQECAILAGFELEKGRDKAEVDRLFNFEDEQAFDFVLNFLRYQNNKTWAVLVSNEEVLFQYQEELLKPVTNYKTDKDKLSAHDLKSKLMAESDKILERIELYEEKIYGTDKDLLNKVRQAPITPEQIANVQTA